MSRREAAEGVKDDLVVKNPSAVDSDDTEEVVPKETQEIPFPELPEGAEYLVSLFYFAGTATQTGMGLIPLSWQEIEAWVRCAGLENSVSPWELSTIKRMSEAYTAEYNRATDPKRKPPYEAVVEEIDRDAVDKKLRNIFAGLSKKKA